MVDNMFGVIVMMWMAGMGLWIGSGEGRMR